MSLVELSELQPKEIVPGFQARFIHGVNVTLAYWEIKAGAALPEHSHPHEQVTNVLKGEFEISMSGETFKLRPGLVLAIPPGIPHSGRAISACQILDVFHPVRDDYR